MRQLAYIGSEVTRMLHVTDEFFPVPVGSLQTIRTLNN